MSPSAPPPSSSSSDSPPPQETKRNDGVISASPLLNSTSKLNNDSSTIDGNTPPPPNSNAPPPLHSDKLPPPRGDAPPPTSISPPPSPPPPRNSKSSPPPPMPPPISSASPPRNPPDDKKSLTREEESTSTLSPPPESNPPPKSSSNPPSPSPTAPPPNLSPPPALPSPPPPPPPALPSPSSSDSSPPAPLQAPPQGQTSPPPPEISLGTPSSVSQFPPAASNQIPPPNFGPPSIGSPPRTTAPPESKSLSPGAEISSSGGAGNNSSKTVGGAVVGGVVLIAVIAIFFAFRRRNSRQRHKGPSYIPPNNFNVNADGFYHGQQQHNMEFSGPTNHSYGSQLSHSLIGDSSGSQRGVAFGGLGPEPGVIGGSKSLFSYEEVTEMTSGFSKQKIIGEGGFGCVYKGSLPDGKVVAVKQLKAGSGQGDREFKAEVEIISRVHHRHLVSLVGYSISDHHRMLIYEFVPNNTLDHHLHGKGMPVLDWPKRLKIAIGSAKGLAYLHEDCHPKIIHRDIKSANILLDDAFEAQVADFGLARLNDTSQTHVSTRVMGTFGYLAPEYASSGKLTDRSDVFSFGVVLLELITGRKPVDPTQPLGDESLVEWARPLLIHALETGDLSRVIDPRLEKHYVESEMISMIETAAACVRHSAPKRPRMAQVVRALDSGNDLTDLTNGVKYGQSTAYDSGQYNEEIMRYRRMALGSLESSEFDAFSSEYTSRDVSRGQTPNGYTSSESESRAMNRIGADHKYRANQGSYIDF
ncbi:hypothetical protein K2173_008299 [Erythroxylum novogranatense]|uniref:non-specific serine/threonine protein kinase n=1 Tax=Erythroxylum novogranatense TaxID=1862640 RepID=A0AAV8U4R1_9ROSI|nr:hypothetical protein K2173_008299 [Erythroxylum novogranatense]